MTTCTTSRTTVVLATIKWDFVWQRHQALAVAAAERSAVVFVESQPRSARQLVSFVLRTLVSMVRSLGVARGAEPTAVVTNPRPDDVRLVGASPLALLWPAAWARLTARSITAADPGGGVDVIVYAPTPAYVQLARRLERTGGTVVYDAVVDWDTVPAGWWPPRRARLREIALPAHWRVASDSSSLAGLLAGAMRRPVDVVLPAADPAFAGYPWSTGPRSGTIGWFGVVRDETDVDLLAHCARSGLAVETIGPVETPELKARLESAGVVVKPALSPAELPAAMAHWDAVVCAYRGARAGTITPAKIFNALAGFTVFSRGLRLPAQLAAAVVDLPADDDAAVDKIRQTLTDPAPRRAHQPQTWSDRLDQLLGTTFSTAGHPTSSSGQASSRGRSLGDAVANSGRVNSTNAIRMILAMLVITFHSFMLTGRAEPPRLVFLGEFEVDVFFVISGFFIAMSWDRTNGIGRFFWHRVVRILPAFWACLVFTAGLAALLAVLQGTATTDFWTSPHNPLAYVWDNALLQMRYFDISGGPTGVAHPGQWNLSLWTLVWEAKAYLGLAVIGLIARYWRGAWQWLPLAALAASLAYMGHELATATDPSNLVRFVGSFCAGMVLWSWRDRVPYDGRIAAACAIVTPLTWFFLQDEYRSVGLVPMAYLTLWVIYSWQAPALFTHDLSYGLYIYAFPAGQVLAMLGVPGWGLPAFVLLTAAVTVPLAATSWFLIEKPAMGYKNASLPRLQVSLPAFSMEGKS